MSRRAIFFLVLLMTLGMFVGSVFAQSTAKSGETDKEESKSVLDKPTESKKIIPPPEMDRPESKIVIQATEDDLISINFFDIEIRKILSALAMKREINIAMAQEVSGKISVHLYKVTLKEALEAITLAGGFSYYKHKDLYYIYKPKETRDPQAERLQIRIFKLHYADVEKVQEILDAIPDMRLIKIHESSKTIIIEDTPENIEKIEKIISFWDRKPKQVLIEVKILEISLTDDMSLGVNWGQILGDVRMGTGGFSTATMATPRGISPVPATGVGIFANMITGVGTSHQFTAALDALQTKTRVDTLSTPKILAIHGKTAKVQVGGQQGYKVTTVTGTGIATETVQFIDTGTILEITPYIDDEDNVRLYVKPRIESAEIQGGVPVVTKTEVSTWLLAKSGQTVFIGGLIRDTKTKQKDMIPCLGSLPGLGVLFGRTSHGIRKSELIVLISPTILGLEQKGADQGTIQKIKKMEKDLKKEPKSSAGQVFESIFPPKNSN